MKRYVETWLFNYRHKHRTIIKIKSKLKYKLMRKAATTDKN